MFPPVIVVKHQKPPRALKSPRAIKALNDMSHRTSQWNNMNAETLKAWEAITSTIPRRNRFGDTVYLSARALFMSIRYDYPPPNPFWDYDKPPFYKPNPPYSFSISLTAGGPYTITPLFDWGISPGQLLTVFVARWQSRSTTHKPRTWIRIGPHLRYPIFTNWYQKFQDANVNLVQGEHVAIKLTTQTPWMWTPPPVQAWATVA